MTKHTVSFEIDTDRLTDEEDSFLFAVHEAIGRAGKAQAPTAAGAELANAINDEIWRRIRAGLTANAPTGA